MSGAYHTQDDFSLFSLVKQGNAEAYKELYDRYWESLFAYTYNCLHLREGAEEIVQDIFLMLWERKYVLTVNSSISAYLFTIAKHKVLNVMRAEKVRKTYASTFSVFLEQKQDNSNEEWQFYNDLEAAIEDRLTALPEKCRIVFKMSRQEHLSIHDIAGRLNISSKTVENYLTQALKHLRTTLDEFMAIVILLIFTVLK